MLCPTSTIWSRAGRAPLGVEVLAHPASCSRELRGAEPERLARGVEVEPELVVVPHVGVAAQVVEHLHPGHGAGPQAVDHQHRDLLRVVRLEHVQPLQLLDAVRTQQAERRDLVLAQRGLVEVIGQRRAEVGFERDFALAHGDGLSVEGVVQFEHERGGGAGVGRGGVRGLGVGCAGLVAGLEDAVLHTGGVGDAEKRRDGEGELIGQVLLGWVLGIVPTTHGDQRHAESVGVEVVPQSVDLVVADKLEAVYVVVVPAGAPQDHVERAEVVRCFQRAAVAGAELAIVAHQPQQSFERLVVEVARAAELWVVAVGALPILHVKQEVMGVEQRRAVQLGRLHRVL